MRKIAILSGLLGVAMLFATGSASLESYVETLKSAKTLKAEFSVNVIGGSVRSFSVELAKPNKARIDKPNELVIADGNEVLTYDKKTKTYYRRPQTEDDLASLFKEDDFTMFAPFFNERSFAAIKTSDGGPKTRKGMQLRLINGSSEKGRRMFNFYLDDQNLARQLELVYPEQDVRWLIDTKSFAIGKEEAPADMFAFKAPAGSRELSAEEVMAGKWFHKLDEAQKIAAATGKLIMIDFYTTWCGPCKKMAAEAFTDDAFMQKARAFALCKLDAEVETGLAAKYKVDAYPTVVFIKPDGTMVHKFVGYMNVNQVLGDMDKALAAR